ncbi:MAG: DHA2 family efflux MFS transporter permease subunit [Ilumatobacteraceae bacterium]
MDLTTIHSRRWWTLAVMNVCLLLTVVDHTILNVALPTLARDLGATGSQLQWIVDSYVLVFAGLLLPAGALGDRFGRRGALYAGLAVFTLGSIGGMLSDTATQLIIARAVMGAGAALIMPATLSIITNVFTDGVERGRAIALWATVGGSAMALGPVIGGWLLEHFHWNSMFIINLPMAAIAFVATAIFVPTSKDPDTPPLDIPGSLLSIVGLTALVWAIINGGEHGWTTASTVTGFAVAVVSLSAFAAWEFHTPHPMLDITFFQNRRFSAASLTVMFGYFAMFGSMFLLTQLLQFVLGYSALGAGVRILPFALTMAAFAPVSARLVERFGTKVVVTGGMTLVATGLMWGALVDDNSTYGGYLPMMLIMGAGVALTWAPATEAIMGSLPPSKAGVGSAVNDTVREVGGALGVAVLGSLVAGRFTSHISSTTDTLPESVRHTASDSLGGALGVAQHLDQPAAGQLTQAARTAFMNGFSLALTVGAVVALFGAALAARWLPARATEVVVEEAEDTEFALAG